MKRSTVDNSAVAVIDDAGSHCCLWCHVILVVVLASSSSLFFIFIVIIAPPSHDAIPHLPLAPWPDGAIVVRSIHNNRTKNAILANATMTLAHANYQGQRQCCQIGVVLIWEMSGIVIVVDIAFCCPVASPCQLPPHSHCAIHHTSTPPPDRHLLLPGQPSERLPTSKPTIFLLFV